MKAEELRGKSHEELGTLLLDLKKEQLNLRFQQTTGELANTARIRTVRRTIARIQTLLSQPEAANNNAPKKAKAKTEKKAETKTAKKEETKKPAAKKAEASKEEK